MFPFHRKKHPETLPTPLGGVGQQSHQPVGISSYPLSASISNSAVHLPTTSANQSMDQQALNISSSPISHQDLPASSYYSESHPSSTLYADPTSAKVQPSNSYTKKSNLKIGETEKDTYRDQTQHLAHPQPLRFPQATSQFYQPSFPIKSQAVRSTHTDESFKRVWIKKNGGTPTSLYVGPNDIVDDLKYMIANKFPTTLALQYDPADLIIQTNIQIDSQGMSKTTFKNITYNNNTSRSANPNLNISTNNLNTSNTNANVNNTTNISTNTNTNTNYSLSKPKLFNADDINSPATANPLFWKPQQPSIQVDRSRSVTPISPEPTKIFNSYLLSQELKNPEPKVSGSEKSTLVLEPDVVVWSVIDKYYPNGMTMADAFLIDVDKPPPAANRDTPNKKVVSNIQNSINNPLNRSDLGYVDLKKSISLGANENKVAILGDQKVPPPRLKSIGVNDHSYGPTPQSSAVILFSKDIRNETKSPILENELNPPPPSPKVQMNTKQEEPVQLSKLAARSHSGDSNKKINLKVDTNPLEKKGDFLKAPLSDCTYTPNSDSASTIKSSTPVVNSITGKKSNNTKKKVGISKMLSHIHVLVVEDNLVNQKIMGRHLKSCNVQFEIASTGQEALELWKKGGFHLCFMDIQLPVMSGIEVTKEIRRLERLNNIGNISHHSPDNPHPPQNPDDVLDLSLFKSPIIIVALTASTGATDQQNALAAGCNDYLTKPVQLKWLKNQLTEWGYMQALINYDYFRAES